MVLEIYVDPMSQPSRALMLFVRVNNIPHEEVIVTIAQGEHKIEEYAKINPFKRVPAIVHDEFKLTESVAILRYLSRQFNLIVGQNWYPEDPEAMGRIDEYMAWQHVGLRLHVSRFILIRIKPGSFASKSNPSSNKIGHFQNKLEEAVNDFVKCWLGHSDFIYGNQVTIADLLAVTELEMPRLVGYNVREGRPQLEAYMDKVKGTLGSHYDQVHSTLYDMADILKDVISKV